jgi:putative transposase
MKQNVSLCDQSIESLNFSLRRITKARGSFPTEQAALKLLYLAMGNATKKWTMPIQDWRSALNRFMIVFEGRLPF